MASSPLPPQPRTTGVTRPSSRATARPMSIEPCWRIVSPSQVALISGWRLRVSAASFMRKAFRETFAPRRRGGVQPLAGLQQAVHLHGDAQVVVGRAELGLGEPLGGHLALARHGHPQVFPRSGRDGAGARAAAGAWTGAAAGRDGARRPRPAFHIALQDAPPGPLPCSERRSTPRSSASRRASGEARTPPEAAPRRRPRPRPPPADGAPPAGAGGAAGAGRGFRGGGRAGRPGLRGLLGPLPLGRLGPARGGSAPPAARRPRRAGPPPRARPPRPAAPCSRAAMSSPCLPMTAMGWPILAAGALRHQDLQERALRGGLVVHGGLVGLHLGEHVPAGTVSPSFLRQETMVPSSMVGDRASITIVSAIGSLPRLYRILRTYASCLAHPAQRTASTILAVEGWAASSRAWLYGMGTSSRLTSATGASRWSKHSRVISQASQAP